MSEPNDVYLIVNNLQKQVVQEALCCVSNSVRAISEQDIENGLNVLNNIKNRFGNEDVDINDAIMYLKYNREFLLPVDKVLVVGDIIPFDKTRLVSFDETQQTCLTDLIRSSKVWLFVTGSIS